MDFGVDIMGYHGPHCPYGIDAGLDDAFEVSHNRGEYLWYSISVSGDSATLLAPLCPIYEECSF